MRKGTDGEDRVEMSEEGRENSQREELAGTSCTGGKEHSAMKPQQ